MKKAIVKKNTEVSAKKISTKDIKYAEVNKNYTTRGNK